MKITTTPHGTGQYLTIDDIQAGQTPTVIDAFDTIMEDFNNIIEIGTYTGGLTTWLYHQNTNINSYDIKDWRTNVTIPDEVFTIGDCFAEDIFNDIVGKIKREGRTLVLCDGGHKEKEFNEFSKFLKPNDVIMLHDYADSVEEFTKYQRELHWPASFESHIDNIDTDGLEKYKYELFCSVLWGSFRKI